MINEIDYGSARARHRHKSRIQYERHVSCTLHGRIRLNISKVSRSSGAIAEPWNLPNCDGLFNQSPRTSHERNIEMCGGNCIIGWKPHWTAVAWDPRLSLPRDDPPLVPRLPPDLPAFDTERGDLVSSVSLAMLNVWHKPWSVNVGRKSRHEHASPFQVQLDTRWFVSDQDISSC